MKGGVVRFGVLAATMAALSTATSTSDAATQTANLGVSATVTANCVISTSPLAFGNYDPVSTHAASPLEGTGTVTVSCTSGASTQVTLGQGLNAAGGSSDTVPLRRLTDAASHFLSYSLFSDTNRTTVWGNTAGTGVGHTGTGTATNLTVYGRVTAGQNVPSGSYADTVVATITF